MLTGKEKQFLRGLAHSLKPIVQIGKNGLTTQVMGQIDEVLDKHELIKVKLVDFKDEKREFASEIEKQLKCHICGIIGNTMIIYRQHKDAAKRKIKLQSKIED